MKQSYTREEALEFLDETLRMCRGIHDICKKCSGWGITTYGSTSTWMGGMGGCAMTPGVCDACWGSGDAERPGVDLRELRDGESKRVAERAVELLAEMAGAPYKSCRPAVLELCAELDRLSRGRKDRPDWFYSICGALSRTIAKGIKE